MVKRTFSNNCSKQIIITTFHEDGHGIRIMYLNVRGGEEQLENIPCNKHTKSSIKNLTSEYYLYETILYFFIRVDLTNFLYGIHSLDYYYIDEYMMKNLKGITFITIVR